MFTIVYYRYFFTRRQCLLGFSNVSLLSLLTNDQPCHQVANVSLPQQTLQVGNVSQQNYGVQIRQPELNPQGRFNAQYGSNAPVVANVQPPVFSPNSVGYEVTHLPNETGVGVHMGQNQLLRYNTPAYGAQLPYQSHTNIQQGELLSCV